MLWVDAWKGGACVSGVAGRPSASPSDPGGSLRRVRRAGLGAFFGSLGVNALLGVVAILSPHFGVTARHTLVTSLLVSAFLVACLAVGPAWERHRLWPVPPLTVLVAALALGGGIAAVWRDLTSTFGERLLSSLTIVAAAGVVACLLSLARLRSPFGLLLRLDLVLLVIATAMLVRTVWTDGAGPAFTRVLGVVLVLLAAGVVATPVLHWISRPAQAAAGARRADAAGFCPFCGGCVTASVGTPATCRRCGSAYTVVASPPALPQQASRRTSSRAPL
jgi:hypothetical protein